MVGVVVGTEVGAEGLVRSYSADEVGGKEPEPKDSVRLLSVRVLFTAVSTVCEVLLLEPEWPYRKCIVPRTQFRAVSG